jgi:hypothetical protein
MAVKKFKMWFVKTRTMAVKSKLPKSEFGEKEF